MHGTEPSFYRLTVRLFVYVSFAVVHFGDRKGLEEEREAMQAKFTASERQFGLKDLR